MKNFLTQWETEEENRKILWNVIGEKPLNLQVGYFLGRKLKEN